MPGRCVLGCTMLVAALACRGPEAGPLALVPPETSQALKVLETTYGLRLPPPLALTVRKPEPNGPGRFHLVVQAPGWSLEGVLETLAVRTEAGPASTAFDWELPADRVGDYAGGAGWSLPLRLSKGGDHRPLIIQAKATQGRTGERAHEAAEIVSLLPIAAVVIETPPTTGSKWRLFGARCRSPLASRCIGPTATATRYFLTQRPYRIR